MIARFSRQLWFIRHRTRTPTPALTISPESNARLHSALQIQLGDQDRPGAVGDEPNQARQQRPDDRPVQNQARQRVRPDICHRQRDGEHDDKQEQENLDGRQGGF